jgi:hypothetical protein
MTENGAVWVRSFIGPFFAAVMGAVGAYMGIRADLAVTIHRVDVIESSKIDHEKRLRELERERGRL